MEENHIRATKTAIPDPIAIDLLSPIIDNLSDLIGVTGLGDFFFSIWFWYSMLAYFVSLILLGIYAYASSLYKQCCDLQDEQILEREKLWEELYRTGPKNDRMQDILNHIESANPNDWKLAIIEADVMLDEALKNKGLGGNSLGERLKSLSPNQLESLDAAWQAHKVRNRIAHDGTDFIVTRKIAEDTIKQYRQVFNELGLR